MGLSERKTKQKIGNDPRNLAWRQDTTSFGAQFLLKAGHTPNTALGLTPENGLINPIAVARKLDNSGIGVGRARREGEQEGGGAGGAGTGLDELLKRLRGDTPSSGGEGGSGERVLGGFAKAGVVEVRDTIVVQQEEASPVASGSGTQAEVVVEAPRVRRLAHRQKFLAAKRMASQSPLAISEITGVRTASPSPFPSALPSPLGTPITSLESESAKEDPNQSELISTNKLSVGDYFKMRMEEKRKGFEAAMKAAAASSTGVASPAEEVVVEEEIVVVGGGEPTLVDAPVVDEEAAVKVGKKEKRKRDETEEEEKARKKEKKEKKRAEKEAAGEEKKEKKSKKEKKTKVVQ